MKKLVFGLIATVMLSVSSFGQGVDNKVKLFCYNISCCHFVVDIDIINTKHCFYATTGKYSLKFEAKEPLKEVLIDEDVIIPEFTNLTKNAMVLDKGNYEIKDNELLYTPSESSKIKKACIVEHVTGNILGHDVDYSMSICVYYWSWKKGKASIKITPELNDDQRNELAKNNFEISFEKDIVVKNEDVSYTIKAGNYLVNEDDSIYILNTELN